ncbi:DUF7662 domain-containing protein [Bradyrhizobium sp. WSM471]|uniref:DUF7662 domain-containing protein n=1 Tax=Bradyrhizobium sp. WSM471 TaxID=319017 RepID=UPI004048F9ED
MSFRKSIYEPLHQRLLRRARKIVRLTFSEIEEILWRKLPAAVHKFTAWWSEESSMKAGHTQARAWMNAGFRAHASIKVASSNSAGFDQDVRFSACRRPSHAGTTQFEVR